MNQLSPELLARLRALQTPATSGYAGNRSFIDHGMEYGLMRQNLGGDTGEGGGGSGAGYISNFFAGKEGAKAGDLYDMFKTSDGSFDRKGIAASDEATKNFLMFLATAATLGVAGPAMNAAMAGGAGSGGAAAGAGFVGEGAASGIGAWDGAMAGASAGQVGGGAAGSGLFNAAADSQLANAALGSEALSGYTAAGAGGVTASPIAGAGGATWMDTAKSLLSKATGTGGGSSLLGLGATALGALGGSEGQKAETSTSSRIDPRMDPYIYGDDGILNMTRNLLNKQMQPGYLQGYDDMRRVGQGLLQTQVRQNPSRRI